MHLLRCKSQIHQQALCAIHRNKTVEAALKMGPGDQQFAIALCAKLLDTFQRALPPLTFAIELDLHIIKALDAWLNPVSASAIFHAIDYLSA